ncbi:1-aminocyclopropane-1-carboxylate deaminase/D-cysteine desulfhydrase [Patulibacter defluvii]|uniref:1-aminocyclopropane-1-carboxylate deaminase/D-cysteine desulfhydrase n=1 Tax=Patulibacter defluvii TaxID=3095358 RepID=UPI002A75581C|nr:pyridoxal-phosphate dependent enzyme [Patulibacter sp. DM4]
MTEPHLHARFPALRGGLPHVALGERPSPVRRLTALEDGPGPELWLKDDGAFGDGGWGGNKVRKLEWLLPDARRRGRRTILTFGGLGTNWGLATALYARDQGLRTALVLVDQPIDDHVRAQLGRLERSGATLHRVRDKRGVLLRLPALLARHAGGGRPPYLLPPGGSSPVGALGYVDAAFELAAQVAAGALPEPAHLVTAVGSGGTAAGLVVGLRAAGLRTRVVGVVVNDQLRLDERAVLGLARRTATLLRRRGADLDPDPDPVADDGLLLVREWLGDGYGHATAEGDRAVRLAGEREGLALDPVYTGKALAALLDMRASGRLGEGPVLFLDTNGPRPDAVR